jgi:type VI secretion system protein ImpL
MSPEALHEFQLADQIKQAFFPTGGNVPSFTMSIVPPILAGSGISARLEVNGTPVASQNQPNTPAQAAAVTVQWPGPVRRSAVTATADPPAPPLPGTTLPGTAPPPTPNVAPAIFERQGEWSWFRLVEAGQPTPRRDGISVRWSGLGRELPYQILTNSLYNPMLLPALREFKCPTQL